MTHDYCCYENFNDITTFSKNKVFLYLHEYLTHFAGNDPSRILAKVINIKLALINIIF